MTGAGRKNNRSGQAIIFFIMVLVVLVFVVLWNYDLHKIVYVKSITQNAGDSAALVAARWQGITLNLIGDLNLMHALALSVGNNAVAAPAIRNAQARLCYVGPMIGFMAAQQAAKNNRMYRNPDFDTLLREHADTVQNVYTTETDANGQMLFPEPYPGCWREYGNMLYLIANDGVAAGPDNAHYYTDYSGSHVLLTIGFYQAISSRNWCWFFINEPDLLHDYENFFPCWWDPLPHIPHVQYINSEIFGLGLTRMFTRLSSFTDFQTISSLATERDLSPPLMPHAMIIPATWYCYNDFLWSSWSALSPTNYFPVAGPVRPQYDYAGADAVVRIEAKTSRITPGQRGSTINKTIVWTAAAKPFGYLNDGQDRPNAYHIVLPAFHDVRLIPIDASSAPSGGSYNLAWRRHIEDHLPEYMADGPSHSGCWYCQQLLTWESIQFRQSGVSWLSSNSWQCVATPGGAPGGGTSIGH